MTTPYDQALETMSRAMLTLGGALHDKTGQAMALYQRFAAALADLERRVSALEEANRP